MQYNININQKSIQDNFPELDLKDAVLLDFILKIKDNPSFTHKTFNQKEYFWLSYSKIIEELPLIGIQNKESLARRFKKLIKLNLLENVVDRSDNSKTYWRSGAEFYKLFFDKLQTQKSIPPDSKVESLQTQKSNNHNTIDHNTKQIKKDKKFNAEFYVKSLNHSLEELLLDWIEIRKAKKAATTQKAIDMAIKKLSEYPVDHQIKMLENSIIAGWTTIYPLKDSDIKEMSKLQESNYQSSVEYKNTNYNSQVPKKIIYAESEEAYQKEVQFRCENYGSEPYEFKFVRKEAVKMDKETLKKNLELMAKAAKIGRIDQDLTD